VSLFPTARKALTPSAFPAFTGGETPAPPIIKRNGGMSQNGARLAPSWDLSDRSNKHDCLDSGVQTGWRRSNDLHGFRWERLVCSCFTVGRVVPERVNGGATHRFKSRPLPARGNAIYNCQTITKVLWPFTMPSGPTPNAYRQTRINALRPNDHGPMAQRLTPTADNQGPYSKQPRGPRPDGRPPVRPTATALVAF